MSTGGTFHLYGADDAAKLWCDRIRKHHPGGLTPELEFQARIWLRTTGTIVTDWIESGFDLTPEEVAERMRLVRSKGLESVLDAIAEKQKAGATGVQW